MAPEDVLILSVQELCNSLIWLRKPVPALEDEKPIDLIASGQYLRVAGLISALEEAPFS